MRGAQVVSHGAVGCLWRMDGGMLGELPQVHPIARALSGTPPRTGQVAGDKCPNNWGLMDKEAARSYSEAWIKEPMMNPRKVV